ASSSAMDLFIRADAFDNVKMTSTKAEDWTIPEVADAMDSGRLTYVGKYSAPDYETILDGGCDLVIENTMIYHSPKAREQLEALGLPVIVENSSYEKHVLGRIEWVKLYGLLTGHLDEAEAFFDDAKRRLDALGQSQPTGKKVAFFYITSSGYVNTRKPGDYVSELIGMAGGDYALDGVSFSDDSKLSTINMDVESFVEAAQDANIIIYNSTVGGAPESIDELTAGAPFLKEFDAVRSGEVWCTGADMFQMTGSLPDVAEELGVIISGDDDEGLSFFKKLR
ncbi:MAG: ABC transporter substrate-binding protein, partial [Lachnospiraceae bacterium]|nr:ABC transporter substrate-binding protein [Lachnospiraceae bacterium]